LYTRTRANNPKSEAHIVYQTDQAHSSAEMLPHWSH